MSNVAGATGLTARAAAFLAVSQWSGEAFVGLLPLLAYWFMHGVAKLPATAVCQVTQPQAQNQCTIVPDSPLPEVCILAVVVSGLALLSLGPHRRKAGVTIWTFFLIIAAIIGLLLGSGLYALTIAHISQDTDVITYSALAIGLVSSLCLAIECAVLDA
jgi:hypothetical protein